MTSKSLRLTETAQRFAPVRQEGALWWQGAVIYEIYPRSFQDSNQDGIGDLRGIEARLPYLAALGVDAIWITPFYKSPMADFGYDVSDYTQVDPMFGDLEDFDRVVKRAHALDLRVLIDFVPNHTSDHHPWFVESRSSTTNPKRDWYIWRSSPDATKPPNNWPSFFGGSAWAWDEHTQQYYLHLFLDRQPDLNWANPDVLHAMQAAMGFWIGRGVDGFRLDAINFLAKHPDLPDLPSVPDATDADLAQHHIYTNNQPELHTILKSFRHYADSFAGNSVFIGETGTLSPRELSEFYGKDNDEIHLPMIFLPFHTPWDARSLRACFVSFYSGLPAGTTPHFVIDNHDARRLTDRYGIQHHRSVGMLLLTLLASPCLYYGDEIGMREVVIPPEKKQDPFDGRMTEHSLGRDPSRTPMRWTAEANAGFTEADVEPWLPIGDDLEHISVAAEENDPRSTLSFYKRLLHLRRDSKALRHGGIAFLDGGEDAVLAYTRELDGERLFIGINFTGETQQLDLATLGKSGQYMLSSEMDSPEMDSLAAVSLRPYESIVVRIM